MDTVSMNVRERYRCLRCNHEWTARNPSSTRRECSRCRSLRVEVVNPPTQPNPTPFTATTSAEPPPASPAVPTSLRDDPDIVKKLKELNLAKLEREIAEVKEGNIPSVALERLDAIMKLLVQFLNRVGVLGSDTADFFNTFCVWCGAERKKGMEYDDGANCWKCRTCGRLVR